MAANNYICKLISNSTKFNFSNDQYQLDYETKPKQIVSLIKSNILSNNDEAPTIKKFDLLINNRLLTSSLKIHLEDESDSNEKVIEIQVFEHFPCPSEQESLQHDDWVKSVRVSSNAILTGCFDNTTHIWSLDGQRQLSIDSTHECGAVNDLAWITTEGTNKKFVTSSTDYTSIIWEWNSNKNTVIKLFSCVGHSGTVECVDVHESQTKIATAGNDGKLFIFPTEMESKPEEPSPKKRKKNESDKETTETTPIEVNPSVVITAHNSLINDLEWINSNELCTASIDNDIKIWDIEKENLIHTITTHQGILSVSYSQLAKNILTAHYDGVVKRWDPRSKGGFIAKKTYADFGCQANACHWSPDSEHHFVCGYDDKMLRLWDTRSLNKPIYNIDSHEDMILCVDWKMPSFIMSGSADTTLKIHKTNF